MGRITLHSCGEHQGLHHGYCAVHGSPPQAWRARHHVPELRPGHRVTSTRVGSTILRRSCRGRRPGSPRGVWKAQPGKSADRRRGRATSTGAEIISDPQNRHTRHMGHPHSCEEHTWHMVISVFHHGSPPQAWRAHVDGPGPDLLRRFTSTSLESTPSAGSSWTPRRDHRHRRGEHAVSYLTTFSNRSSPPPVFREHRL